MGIINVRRSGGALRHAEIEAMSIPSIQRDPSGKDFALNVLASVSSLAYLFRRS
jgi:hypothetical protein